MAQYCGAVSSRFLRTAHFEYVHLFFFLLLCYCQIERRLMTLRMLTNATTLTMPLCHNIRSQSQVKLLWFRDNPLGKCWRQDLLLRV